MAADGKTMEISVNDLTALAVEHWRLSTWLASASGNTGVARHAVRRIGDLLQRWEVEIRALDHQPYDAGLAATVVDSIDDPSLAKGTEVVDETVSPQVIWKGTVIRSAEIVVRRGTGKK